MSKSELSLEHLYSKQADRLLKIGQLFLDIDPLVESTGRTSRIFHLWIPEDAELPELKDQEEEFEEVDRHNREHNERMRSMPTSIQSNTDYYVARGNKSDEVRIITEHTRVDPGYKTPTVEFPDLGDPEENNRRAAEYLTQHFISLRNRSPEERAIAEGRRILQETLLTHEVKEIVLSPELLAQNELVILQHDLMTGVNSETKVDFSNASNVPEDIYHFLSMVEFNFLSEMQQQRNFKEELAPKHRERMNFIINDFLGK
jgi:hypothetical protein